MRFVPIFLCVRGDGQRQNDLKIRTLMHKIEIEGDALTVIRPKTAEKGAAIKMLCFIIIIV